jgi:hypothetical protein
MFWILVKVLIYWICVSSFKHAMIHMDLIIGHNTFWNYEPVVFYKLNIHEYFEFWNLVLCLGNNLHVCNNALWYITSHNKMYAYESFFEYGYITVSTNCVLFWTNLIWFLCSKIVSKRWLLWRRDSFLYARKRCMIDLVKNYIGWRVITEIIPWSILVLILTSIIEGEMNTYMYDYGESYTINLFGIWYLWYRNFKYVNFDMYEWVWLWDKFLCYLILK